MAKITFSRVYEDDFTGEFKKLLKRDSAGNPTKDSTGNDIPMYDPIVVYLNNGDFTPKFTTENILNDFNSTNGWDWYFDTWIIIDGEGSKINIGYIENQYNPDIITSPIVKVFQTDIHIYAVYFYGGGPIDDTSACILSARDGLTGKLISGIDNVFFDVESKDGIQNVRFSNTNQVLISTQDTSIRITALNPIIPKGEYIKGYRFERWHKLGDRRSHIGNTFDVDKGDSPRIIGIFTPYEDKLDIPIEENVVLIGVTNDGAGWILSNGKIVKVPKPDNPLHDIFVIIKKVGIENTEKLSKIVKLLKKEIN